MKGIIFNLVEDSVVEAHGLETWDRILEKAGLDGAYTTLGNYPDVDFVALVSAGSSLIGIEPQDLTRQIGRESAGRLAERFPRFFAPHGSVRSFLLTLNDVIHPEVLKLHLDSTPPAFWFEGHDPERLVVHYRSPRRLCSFAEGLIEGSAEHYGQKATVTQTRCMLEGADHCVLDTAITEAVAR